MFKVDLCTSSNAGQVKYSVGNKLPEQWIDWSAIPSGFFFPPDFVFLGFLPLSSISDRYHTQHTVQEKKELQSSSFSSNMTNGIVNGNGSLETQFGQFLALVHRNPQIHSLQLLSVSMGQNPHMFPLI